MSDDEKRIIVDDDWKAEAQREKEHLAEEVEQPPQGLPEASFVELLNVLVMQALAGLGMIAGPGGQRIPPNLGAAKHFVDLLQVLNDKTQGNLTDDESKVLSQVLYDLRMRYVQVTSGGGAIPPGAAPGPDAAGGPPPA